MKLELHIHTRYSKDSALRLWIIYLICRIKKISCIAITDHNTIKGAVEFKKRYDSGARHGIKVIIGEEIMTSKGEIIGLFLKEKIEKGKSPKETIDEIINQGGIVYIPHPYDEKRSRTVLNYDEIERYKDKITCIECYNGRNISELYGINQNRIAEKLNVMKVVGSDAHTSIELGRNFLEIKGEYDITNKQEFINGILNAKLIKKPCLKISHIITKYVKMFKMILRGEFYEVLRIINKRIRERM